MVRQQVEGAGAEQQVERRAFEWRAAGARPRIRDLDQRMALPLCLGFEPERSQEMVGGELNAIVREPAFGTSGGRAARRLVGLEQLELPGVAGIPQRGTAARATAADGGLAVHRAEARVVEPAGGRVQAAPGTPRSEEHTSELQSPM